MKQIAALVLLLSLTACGSGGSGPGGVTAEESRALDEAAQMIESRRLQPDALAPMTPTPSDSAGLDSATPQAALPATKP